MQRVVHKPGMKILARREKVAQAVLRGYTQQEIAKSLGTTQQQISRDVEWLEARALERTDRGADKWKAMLNERVAEIFFRAIRAWDKSAQRHDGEGDPRYLAQARAACEEHAKLNGAYEPFQTRLIDEDGKDILSRLIPSLSIDELDMLDRVFTRMEALEQERREVKAIDVESRSVTEPPASGNGKPSANGNGHISK